MNFKSLIFNSPYFKKNKIKYTICTTWRWDNKITHTSSENKGHIFRVKFKLRVCFNL